METLQWEHRTVIQKGIWLPWERVEKYGPQRGGWEDHPPKGTVLESGRVFIKEDTLYELAEQGVYDSQFGNVLLLSTQEGLALEKAGLAVQETKGGYHGTDVLRRLLDVEEKGI